MAQLASFGIVHAVHTGTGEAEHMQENRVEILIQVQLKLRCYVCTNVAKK